MKLNFLNREIGLEGGYDYVTEVRVIDSNGDIALVKITTWGCSEIDAHSVLLAAIYKLNVCPDLLTNIGKTRNTLTLNDWGVWSCKSYEVFLEVLETYVKQQYNFSGCDLYPMRDSLHPTHYETICEVSVLIPKEVISTGSTVDGRVRRSCVAVCQHLLEKGAKDDIVDFSKKVYVSSPKIDAVHGKPSVCKMNVVWKKEE